MVDTVEKILVGSRCGGFDFFCKKVGESEYIWLGATENSDIDMFFETAEEYYNFKKTTPLKVDTYNKKKFKTPNMWLGCEFPYNINGEVFIPKDKTYLSWAIRKKYKIQRLNAYKINGHEFDIYDKDKNYVTTIKFKRMP